MSAKKERKEKRRNKRKLSKDKSIQGSVENLLDRIKNYPHTSRQYKIILKRISKRLEAQYGDQCIMSIPNEFRQDDLILLSDQNTYELEEMGIGCIYRSSNIRDLLGSKNAFDVSSNVQYNPRCDVEYDIRYKQILVFGYITDGKKYILLEKPNGVITFIGGHVDFIIPQVYTMDMVDYLEFNLIRELREEIEIGKGNDWDILMKTPPKLLGYIDTMKTEYDYFNNGVIYRIQVDDIDDIEEIRSGEPDKHYVRIFNSRSDVLRNKNLHSWVSTIFEAGI